MQTLANLYDTTQDTTTPLSETQGAIIHLFLIGLLFGLVGMVEVML